MIRPSEQALLEVVAKLGGSRVLCTSLSSAPLAAAVAERFPAAQVCCCFLDLYRAQQARQLHADRPNLSILCQTDLPPEEADVAAMPFTAQGEGELTRELMQQAHQALRIGGRMLVSTDNVDDTWLGAEMWKLFDKVTRRVEETGVLYMAAKTKPLKKFKNFAAEFAFRDRGRLIRAASRPGVFAHRRIDPGARSLLRVMELRPGDRVADMGCGSGVLSLAAAMRETGVTVHAIDSNPRAVECTRCGAELNELWSVKADLSADGTCLEPGVFDLFLANPPYYSNYRIAEIFLDAGRRALRPGGEILVVTKDQRWYLETMPKSFRDVRVEPVKDYRIVCGRARGA